MSPIPPTATPDNGCPLISLVMAVIVWLCMEGVAAVCAVSSTSVMPLMGQLPGSLRFISGCIGQV
jgi:hypothetical protein